MMDFNRESMSRFVHQAATVAFVVCGAQLRKINHRVEREILCARILEDRNYGFTVSR